MDEAKAKNPTMPDSMLDNQFSAANVEQRLQTAIMAGLSAEDYLGAPTEQAQARIKVGK